MDRIRIIAAACVALAGLAAIQSPATAEDAAAPPPERGTCYSLTYRQLQAPSLPAAASAVECDQRHTYEVTGVFTVPASIAKRGINSMAVVAWSHRQCLTSVSRYPGRTHGRWYMPNRAFRSFYFLPSKSRWVNGVRSLVCGGAGMNPKWNNVVVATSSIRSESGGPSRFQAICARYWPKKGKLLYRRCNLRNSFPAIAELTVGTPTQRFPGHDKVMKMARKASMRVLRGAPGYWTVYAATKKNWKRGNRLVRVFSPHGI